MNLLEEAITNRPFHQLHLLPESQFASFLSKRGLDVGFRGIRSFVDLGIIEELGDQMTGFHPFQLWPISNILGTLETKLDTGIRWHGLEPKGLKRFIDINWCRHADHLGDLQKSNELILFNRRILPLLLWIESYFLPVVRGSRKGLVTLVNVNEAEWNKWRASINFDDWLCRHSLSIQLLSEWREQLLMRAFHYDPTPDLYLLLRSMPFDRRDRFKDRLRLAYDLYEIAEITRLFLESIDDWPVRKEWDPTGEPNTRWVERFYGSQPKFGTPEFLRPLARRHGLDPAPRVRWLVEGETEKGFILGYTKRLAVTIEDYATVSNLGGDGALTGRKHIASVERFLAIAREEQCFVALTFDESRDARMRIERLIQDELVNLCFVLNDPDFELECLGVHELVTVAMALASDSPHPITLCHEYLVEEVKQRIKEKNEGFQKAFNNVLYLNEEEFELHKGTEWGTKLADFLFDRRETEANADGYSEDTLTKMERQVLKVLRGSQPAIDFPLSVERIDPKTLEILCQGEQ